MPTAVALAVSGAPRVAQRAGAKRAAIAKPAALPSRRSTRSCVHSRSATLVSKVRRVRLRRRLRRCATSHSHLTRRRRLWRRAARAAPPPSEVSLGGKLRAVCQVLFPSRATPRQAVKVSAACWGAWGPTATSDPLHRTGCPASSRWIALACCPRRNRRARCLLPARARRTALCPRRTCPDYSRFQTMEQRVRAVMEEYLELQHGASLLRGGRRHENRSQTACAPAAQLAHAWCLYVSPRRRGRC